MKRNGLTQLPEQFGHLVTLHALDLTENELVWAIFVSLGRLIYINISTDSVARFIRAIIRPEAFVITVQQTYRAALVRVSIAVFGPVGGHG